MSTVIYHAYRFKSNRASTVEKNNTYIREIMAKKLKSSIYRKITELFIEYKFYLLSHPEKPSNVDTVNEFFEYTKFEHSTSQLQYLLNTVKNKMYSATKFYKLYAEMTTEATKFNLELSFNHKITVYFRTVGEYTYYLFTSRDESILNEFRNDFEKYMPEKFTTYDYWNNTDGPDNISEAAWRGRGNKWDKVFRSRPSVDMNKIDIEMELYYLSQYEKCIEHIPDDFDLFKMYYQDLKGDTYIEEEMEKNIKATGNKRESVSYRDSVRRIREELANGTALVHYPAFLMSDFTRDKIIDALFYTKIEKSVNDNDNND